MSYYHQDQRDAAVGIGCVVLATLFVVIALSGIALVVWAVS